MAAASAPDSEAIDALVADVLEAAGALRRHGDQQAAAVGQTQARWQVLSVLSGEPQTVPGAARRLGVSRQAVQRVADLLRKDDLIQLSPNPAHASSPLLSLTASGRSALAALTEQNRTWNRLAMRSLDAKAVEEARRVLGELTRLSRDARGSEPNRRP